VRQRNESLLETDKEEFRTRKLVVLYSVIHTAQRDEIRLDDRWKA
jgi:hypothetical protein